MYIYIYIQYNIFQSPGSRASRSHRPGFKKGGKFVGTRFLSYKHTYINIRAVSDSFIDYYKLFSGEYLPCNCMCNCKSPRSDVCSRE